MDKIKLFIEKSYKTIAYVAIICLLILINYYHIFTTGGILASIQNIAFVIAELTILILLNVFIIDKIKPKVQKVLIIVFMILFVVLTVSSSYYFRVKYNWDFKWVMDSAKDIANIGKTENIYYFKIFPNNLGSLIISTIAMKIFFGKEIGAYVVNIVFIFLAALFAVLSAKKIGGNKLALNTIIFIICSAPLYLYAPIIYSDTLSVAFPVMTLYFWLTAKEQKEKSKRNYYLAIIAMTIAAVIGYCVKPVAAIVFVAIIIDEFFTNKKVLKSGAIAIVLFIILITAFNKVTSKWILRDERKNEHEYPMTHWIMMGLNTPEDEGGSSIGYGAYSQDDSNYTATSGNYEEKKKANIEKIKERLKDFGPKGYIKFLYKKIRYVWNDGTYYMANIIGWDTINTTSLPYKIVLGEKSKVTKQAMTYFNNTLFLIILLGFCLDLKGTNQPQRILGISMVGIAMFLVLWEARSRYIYFMIPVFCNLGAIGIESINNRFKNIINKKGDKG